MPLTLPAATVETDHETALQYQWVLNEFETHPRTGRPVLESGQPIRINPVHFPLHNAMVTMMGSRASISIPRPGKPHCVVDRLLQVGEPKKRVVKGRRRPEADDDDAFTISGVSELMLKQGIRPEDAIVTFHVSGRNVTETK